MAKKLKKTVNPVEPKQPEVKAETIETVPSVMKVKAEETEVTVTSSSEAEFYQKSGWRLINVSRSGFNKVYKFQRGK